MIYGYARVSTKGQAKDGNSLEAQEKALKERGCDVIYTEAFTGTTTNRPKFTELIDKLHKGDTLVVTKLDRFSRTAGEGAELVKQLHNRGVTIHILNMGMVDNSTMGKLMVNMLLAFAEFEHDNILERLNTGKEIAKSHGKKVDGRYSVEIPDFEKFLKKQKDGEMSVTECCKALGISRGTWYNRVSEVG
jgi:DNA invertase Pin-like site-specific DNA recombinase